MSAIRLPLLCAFAGGCLSNALLFGLWRASESSGASDAKPPHHAARVVQVDSAPSAVPNVAEQAQPSPIVVSAVVEPAPARDADNAAPAGSAVSDVLMRLESAYREQVAARAPVPAPPVQEAAVPEVAPIAVAAPVPPPPVAAVVPVAPPVATVAAAPPVVAPPVVAPPAPAPAYVAANAPASPAVHYGDVNQNTYITNVRQGDLYLIQVQQQLAMLQYMQLMGLSGGMAAPMRGLGGAAHQRTQFPSGITNPDNPWGFHFAPPNLVR